MPGLLFWKIKKGTTVTNTSQNVLNKSGRKPKKTWVGKGSKFYNWSIKSWLQNNKIEMYSIHNIGKSVFAEKFIRALKNKIYWYISLILKCMQSTYKFEYV